MIMKADPYSIFSLSGLILAIGFLLASCTPTEKMMYHSIESDYFIYDYQSRYSQSKLRQIKEQMAGVNVGLAVFGLLATTVDVAVNDTLNVNHFHFFSSEISNFIIQNKSSYKMEVNMITEEMIDSKSSASIRKIVLPSRAKVRLLVPDNTFYVVKCWNTDTDDVDFIDIYISGRGGITINNRGVYSY